MTKHSLNELTLIERIVWRELHQQHKKIVYLQIPRLQTKIEDKENELIGLQTQIDSCITDANTSIKFGDQGRAEEMQKTAQALSMKLTTLRINIDFLICQCNYDIGKLNTEASLIASHKSTLIAGTDDIRFNHITQKRRTDLEEKNFAADEHLMQCEIEAIINRR